MASLSHDGAGDWRVQFIAPDGRRVTLRVPGPRAVGEELRRHVGLLRCCQGHPDAVPERTLRWALALPASDYDRLAAAAAMRTEGPADA